MDGANRAQVAYWNSAVTLGWLTEQERFDALFASVSEVALDAAQPRAGERVVDVGCGAGATVVALAHRVGAGGDVLGVDVAERLVARARERIATAGIAEFARVELADAAAYPFTSNADLVFSRFGVMFFADPVAAFSNLHRAVRSSGRLAFVAWQAQGQNPWFTVPLRAARARVSLPEGARTEPGAPGPFAFDDAARVKGILADAGWRDVEVRPHVLALQLGAPGDFGAAAGVATRVGPLARALADADAESRRMAEAAVAEALRAYDGPGGITLPGAVWIVSARA